MQPWVYHWNQIVSVLDTSNSAPTRMATQGFNNDERALDCILRTVDDVPSFELVSVDFQDNLISAIETMFEYNYSQLGVENDGQIIGMVSYRSISRVLSILRTLGADKNLPGRTVQIAIEDVEPVVEPTDDLVVLFDLLAEDPYVLVDDPDQESLQILTNYDLLYYLRDSIEPFLMIEDIEISIRTLLQEAFPDDLDGELHDFYQDKDIRTPDGLTDCSFGHYPQFMCQNWTRFESYFEENGDFVRRLISEIGDIRNQIFHFRSGRHNPDVDEALLHFAHSYFADRISRTPSS
jgi:predicted transcriptional regulator